MAKRQAPFRVIQWGTGAVGKYCIQRTIETPNLRHQRNERRLPQVGRLASHIRTGNEQNLLRAAIEIDVIRHKALALLFE